MTPSVRCPTVLALPAALFRRLPAPATLACRAADLRGAVRSFWVTTSGKHHSAARNAFLPVVDGHEWLALCIAAEARQTALALAQWLTPREFGDLPEWCARGTLYDLTGGTFQACDRATAWDAVPMRVTVGDVLAHFDAELVGWDPPPESAARPEGQL